MIVRWTSGVTVHPQLLYAGARIPACCLIPKLSHRAKWIAPAPTEDYFVGTADWTRAEIDALMVEAVANGVRFTVFTEPTRLLSTAERGSLDVVPARTDDTEDSYFRRAVAAFGPATTVEYLEAKTPRIA